MPVSAYPPDFASAVRKHWPPWMRAELKTLPPDDVIRTVAEVAYHASFRTEEGRPLVFRIVLSPPDELADEHGRLFPAAIKFEISRSFTIPELTRLAPASDPRRLLIGVQKSGDALQIWGLLDIGSARQAQLEGDVSDRSVPQTPNALMIGVAAAGVLQASFGDTFLLELSNGALRYEYADVSVPPAAEQHNIGVFGQGPIADFFLDAQRRFLQIVGKPEYDPPLALGDAMQAFGVLFERLLVEMTSKRHGGALLLVPSTPPPGCASAIVSRSSNKVPSLLDVKYPCDDYRLWLSLQGAIGARQHYRTLAGWLFPKEGTTPGEMKAAAEAKSDRANELADVASSIVSLTAVDGAIVLTDDLRLLGFGAVILPGAETPAVFFASDDFGTQGDLRRADGYGTRHRSAFRFAATYPDGVAFVVSQDGDAKAIRALNGRVTVWDHILDKRLSGSPGFLQFVRGLRGQR